MSALNILTDMPQNSSNKLFLHASLAFVGRFNLLFHDVSHACTLLCKCQILLFIYIGLFQYIFIKHGILLKMEMEMFCV